jgi:cytochrome c oxidase cbb3-type subunit I/II
LSAFKDPLSKQPLAISAQDRAALNDPKLEADTPDKAFVPGATQRAAASGAAVAEREAFRAPAAAAARMSEP